MGSLDLMIMAQSPQGYGQTELADQTGEEYRMGMRMLNRKIENLEWNNKLNRRRIYNECKNVDRKYRIQNKIGGIVHRCPY
jgi:hypothetical protein